MTTLIPNFGFRAADQEASDVRVVHLDMRRAAAGIGEDDLHAYVDGLLGAERRPVVEGRLAQDPARRAAVTAYRDLNIDLHRLFDVALPLPDARLSALSRELDRRMAQRHILSSLPNAAWAGVSAFATGMRKSIMRGPRWLAGNPFRRADAGLVFDRTAAAIDRSPLVSVVVVAGFIVLAGVGWPMLAGQPASCADRVEAAAKQVAKGRLSPELAERLASVGFMCRVGETERADQLLARLGEEARQPQH
ncbi:MAG: hypothetical protein JNL04_01380 [Rhodospirillaceae bacterium]|nr:hypothetical protein [Rhodospirillaceae bacterium]